MQISKYVKNELDYQHIAKFKSELHEITSRFGQVDIEYKDKNSDKIYRISLSKKKAIKLLEELYILLEDEL